MWSKHQGVREHDRRRRAVIERSGSELIHDVGRLMPVGPDHLLRPMRAVVAELVRHAFDLAAVDALEMFARAGDWHTQDYAGEVRSLEAWELDPQFEAALRKNLPRAVVRIGDAFEMAAGCHRQYGFVVCDAPLTIFDGHCEHFEVVPLLPRLLADGVLVLNVNLLPYGLSEQPEWYQRRQRFYGRKNVYGLTDPWARQFYRRRLAEVGLSVQWDFSVPRNAFLSYYVARVTEA